MSGETLTIGEVIGRLAADFPDLTVSKIRYLESGGLISPGRTPAGYRRFSEEDVEKLRWVLAANRNWHLDPETRRLLSRAWRGHGQADAIEISRSFALTILRKRAAPRS